MNYSLPISKILLLILLFIIAYTYNAKAENIFFDDFETDKGWQVNPNSTDNATTGMWERENPQSTEYRGRTIQLGETISGNYCLVTGHLAGSSVGTYDIDNGVTSIKSPDITLPDEGDITLTFSYYLGYHTNASTS